MPLIILNVIDGLNRGRDGVLSPYDCFLNGRTDKGPVLEVWVSSRAEMHARAGPCSATESVLQITVF